MRFYSGAHEVLLNTSKQKVDDQLLFLVAEVDNNHDINAVMLHNGKQKLGSVTATEAPRLKQMLQKWRDSNDGKDDVVVCRMWRIDHSLDYFKNMGSISVRGVHRVNERLARKFSDFSRKG